MLNIVSPGEAEGDTLGIEVFLEGRGSTEFQENIKEAGSKIDFEGEVKEQLSATYI